MPERWRHSLLAVGIGIAAAVTLELWLGRRVALSLCYAFDPYCGADIVPSEPQRLALYDIGGLAYYVALFTVGGMLTAALAPARRLQHSLVAGAIANALFTATTGNLTMLGRIAFIGATIGAALLGGAVASRLLRRQS